jgi:hypothetical protein
MGEGGGLGGEEREVFMAGNTRRISRSTPNTHTHTHTTTTTTSSSSSSMEEQGESKSMDGGKRRHNKVEVEVPRLVKPGSLLELPPTPPMLVATPEHTRRRI